MLGQVTQRLMTRTISTLRKGPVNIYRISTLSFGQNLTENVFIFF